MVKQIICLTIGVYSFRWFLCKAEQWRRFVATCQPALGAEFIEVRKPLTFDILQIQANCDITFFGQFFLI